MDGIPCFRDDGYLPEGIHRGTEAEVTFRFGTGSRQRKRLIVRLRRWIELGRAVGAQRLLVDGSFVTSKGEPEDIDAVMLVPASFSALVQQGVQAAMELEEMFLTRQPEELFPAENEAVWQGWCEFFKRTREPDRRRKGLVEPYDFIRSRVRVGERGTDPFGALVVAVAG
jgi:hypothetical protein